MHFVLYYSQYTPAMGTVSLVTTLLEVHMRSSFQQRQGTPPYTSSQEAVTIEMADLRVDIGSRGEAKRNEPNLAYARFRIEITDTGMHTYAIRDEDFPCIILSFLLFYSQESVFHRTS